MDTLIPTLHPLSFFTQSNSSKIAFLRRPVNLKHLQTRRLNAHRQDAAGHHRLDAQAPRFLDELLTLRTGIQINLPDTFFRHLFDNFEPDGGWNVEARTIYRSRDFQDRTKSGEAFDPSLFGVHGVNR